MGSDLKIQTKGGTLIQRNTNMMSVINPASGKELTYARDCTEISDEGLFNCTTKNFNGNVVNLKKKYFVFVLLLDSRLLWSIFIHSLKVIHTCFCHGNGCNKSFDTAAGSKHL